jgi:hypothetical protein
MFAFALGGSLMSTHSLLGLKTFFIALLFGVLTWKFVAWLLPGGEMKFYAWPAFIVFLISWTPLWNKAAEIEAAKRYLDRTDGKK